MIIMTSISLFIIWTFLTLFGLFTQATGQQGYSSYYSGTRDNPWPQNYNTDYGNQPGRSDYYGYYGVGSKGSSSGFNPYRGNENYGRYGNSWNSNSYGGYPSYGGYQGNRGSQNYPNPPTYSRYGDSERYQGNRGSYGNQGNYDPNREILPGFGSYNYGNRENNQGYNGYYGDSRYGNEGYNRYGNEPYNRYDGNNRGNSGWDWGQSNNNYGGYRDNGGYSDYGDYRDFRSPPGYVGQGYGGNGMMTGSYRGDTGSYQRPDPRA